MVEDTFVFPTSFAQQRLWFLDLLEPGSPAFNISTAMSFKGRLDVTALERSLNEIVKRHEALRTTFSAIDGQPIQVVVPYLVLSLPVKDLRELPEDEREAAALKQATDESRQSFDLAVGPLLRTTLYRLGSDHHILSLTIHHIVSDGWSMGVLTQEIAALYEAFCEGKPSPLNELPIQYADFAVWQRESMKGKLVEEQLSYWRKQLGGNLPVLELPTDRPRPALQTYRGARHYVALPDTLTEALKALSRSEGATLFMTLLAAFKLLLYRYTGQCEMTVGTSIANRTRPETERLIGFFLNTLVLRADLSGNRSFRELLAHVREVALGAYANQDVPVETVLEMLQPERNLSHNPLFQVMLILQNTPMPAINLPGLTLNRLEIDNTTAKFDLTLELSEKPEGLSGFLEYNTDLFDASTIARMEEHFKTLLESIVANPQQRLSSLSLLTEVERHQLLAEWNHTRADGRADKCVHELFEAQVERTPEASAVIFGEGRLTYRELNSRANQLAHHLRALGVGPEARVGVCMERSAEMMIALLGVLKSGGAYLPLDPAYPKERLALILEEAGSPVLLTKQWLGDSFSEFTGEVLCLDSQWQAIAQQSEENPVNRTEVESLAYVIYTSGSTGKPKGVMIQHGSLAGYAETASNEYAIGPKDRVLQFASISFDTSAEEIYPCLLRGATLVLRTDSMLSSVPEFLEKCRQWSITVLDLPTAYWHEVAARLDAEASVLPQSLRLVIIGGEKALSDRLAKWRAYAGEQVRLVNTYGPTEATVVTTMCELPSQSQGGPEVRDVPIGRPIRNAQTYVLDELLQPAPIGIPGELYIGGEGLARGYLGRQELTAERFIPNPFNGESGSRLYKTGDLARYSFDGAIEFVGRVDQQVKVWGFRIELGEIECLLGQHPSVRETVVLAHEESSGNKQLVAYVVADQQAAPTTGELRDFLKKKLPHYMVPAVFLMLDALPMTPSGKLDRRALPAPGRNNPELTESFVAPGTPVEEVVAGIWAETLRLEQVGVYDDFFELGGHSLLATQVVSRLREALQVEMPLRSFFEYPTVAGLAEQIEIAIRARQGLQAPPLRPVARDRELPLSFAQERLWFLNQLDPESAAYHVLRPLHLTGELDVELLERSVSEVLRRHEVYRTTFPNVDGRPIQVIHPPHAITIPIIDLRMFPEAEREAEAHRIILEEGRRVFDLAQGPLWRLILLRLEEREHVLMLTEHHMVHDGWTEGALVRDFLAVYAASLTGETADLPELPIQYADFAYWQRQWLQGEVMESLLSYWKETLKGAPAVLELPADRPRPAVQTFRGAVQSFTLSPDLSKAINTFSRREGVTLFMTLVAAFKALLHRYSRQEDIVISTSIANRNWVEVENLTGFFVNTLLLRTDFSADPTIRELLGRVREVALGAYAHQDMPFEKLVEALHPERDLNRQALFQVMFHPTERAQRDYGDAGIDGQAPTCPQHDFEV